LVKLKLKDKEDGSGGKAELVTNFIDMDQAAVRYFSSFHAAPAVTNRHF
jgi:hypothetical protein